MRRRTKTGGAAGGGAAGPDEPAAKAVRRQLRKLDFFDKVKAADTIQTGHGGVQTLLTYVAMLVLFLGEMRAYLSTNVSEHVVVDPSSSGRLRINVNVTFAALNCRDVSLVAMDVAGEHQLGIDHTVHKHRVDARGETIGERFRSELGKAAAARDGKDGFGGADAGKDGGAAALPEAYCGSCYGAGGAKRAGGRAACCNTCDDVRAAYETKGWDVSGVEGTAEQCVREAKNPAAAAKKDEGCNIEGSLTVNKVAGNIHVALGKSRSVNGRLIHQFSPRQLEHFDTSHRIHTLSFGEPFPGQTNPLDGKSKRVNPHASQTGVFQYFIKIIPTQFTTSRGVVTASNQYSFTEKFVAVGEGDGGSDEEDAKRAAAAAAEAEKDGEGKPGDGKAVQPKLHQGHLHKHPSVIRALPGVFFIYDMSPFMVLRTEDSQSFLHFLVRVCAVVGGVFTTSAMLSRFFSFVVSGGKKRTSKGEGLGFMFGRD